MSLRLQIWGIIVPTLSGRVLKSGLGLVMKVLMRRNLIIDISDIEELHSVRTTQTVPRLETSFFC